MNKLAFVTFPIYAVSYIAAHLMKTRASRLLTHEQTIHYRLPRTPLKDTDPRDVHRYVAAHSLYKSRLFDVARFVLFSSRPTRGSSSRATSPISAGPSRSAPSQPKPSSHSRAAGPMSPTA
jgi:hypothetical protein